MAGDMEIINMNYNVATTANVNATEGLGQSQATSGANSMQAMDQLSTSMTAPGNCADSSEIVAKMTNAPVENTAKVEEFMANTDASSSYLNACDDSGDFSVSAESRGLTSLNSEAGAVGAENTVGTAQNSSAQNDTAQLEQCMDQCFGNTVSEAEKHGIKEFYSEPSTSDSKATVAESNSTEHTIASQNNVKTDVRSDVNSNVKLEPKVSDKTVATETAKNSNIVANKAKTEIKDEVLAKENIIRQENARKEAEIVELNVREANIEQDVRIGSLRNGISTTFASNGNATSKVLDQYLHNKADVSNNSTNALNSEYSYEYAQNLEMSSISTNLEGETANIISGNYQAESADVSKNVGNIEQLIYPLDMVGSTAMSNNMANLEELVNIDLMAKFSSGFSSAMQ